MTVIDKLCVTLFFIYVCVKIRLLNFFDISLLKYLYVSRQVTGMYFCWNPFRRIASDRSYFNLAKLSKRCCRGIVRKYHSGLSNYKTNLDQQGKQETSCVQGNLWSTVLYRVLSRPITSANIRNIDQSENFHFENWKLKKINAGLLSAMERAGAMCKPIY